MQRHLKRVGMTEKQIEPESAPLSLTNQAQSERDNSRTKAIKRMQSSDQLLRGVAVEKQRTETDAFDVKD